MSGHGLQLPENKQKTRYKTNEIVAQTIYFVNELLYLYAKNASLDVTRIYVRMLSETIKMLTRLINDSPNRLFRSSEILESKIRLLITKSTPLKNMKI
jgi:hypothetical protein